MPWITEQHVRNSASLDDWQQSLPGEVWTWERIVKILERGDAGAQREFVEAYTVPIEAFFREHNFSPGDATQKAWEFFLGMFVSGWESGESFLHRAWRDGGSFQRLLRQELLGHVKRSRDSA